MLIKTFRVLILATGIFFFSLQAWSSPVGFTFQGRLADANGDALNASNVDLFVSILSPGAEACVLYEEQHTLNFQNSDGVFSIRLGGGVRVGDDQALALDTVFSNSAAMSGLTACAVGTTYTPSASDFRFLYVSFNDGSGAVDFATPYVIRSVPYALETNAIAGYEADNLCRVADGGTPQTVSPLTSANFTELLALINGTSAQYTKASASTGTRLAVVNGSPASPASGSFWLDSSSGALKYYDGSSTITLGDAAAINATNITSGTLSSARLPLSGVAASTYKSVTVDTYGRVTGGTNPTSLSGYGITDAVQKGGQAGALSLGPSDSNALSLQTNGTTRMTVAAGGDVFLGSGTLTNTSANEDLSITGNLEVDGIMYGNASGLSNVPAASGTLLVGGNAEGAALSIGTTDNYDVTLVSNNSAGIVLKTSGRLGLGTASPEAKLDVQDTGTTTSAIIVPRAGTFTGTPVNGMIRFNTVSNLFEFRQNGNWINYTTISDGRLKRNVRPVDESLDLVNQLRPVYFEWDESNPKTASFDKKPQVGFIAQEVKEHVPEAVDVGEDGLHSMKYGNLVAVAIGAIKDLYAQLLGQGEELEELQRENAAMKSYLCERDPAAPFCVTSP